MHLSLRHGYLFQNRYKSILRQEEPYRLELVRYLGESEFVAAAVAGLPPADLVTPSLA